MEERPTLQALRNGKVVSIKGVLFKATEEQGLKPGDTYIAERNSVRLLTVQKLHEKYDWVIPTDWTQYYFNTGECVKVRRLTPEEEREYRHSENLQLIREELAKGASEEDVTNLLWKAGDYSAHQAVELVRMAKQSIVG